MLLAPFSLSEPAVRPRSTRHAESRWVPLWLQVWAIGGLLATALFPYLRGGEMTGLSLPFWLVAAPLINIAWLGRSRWLARIRDLGTSASRRHGKRSRRIS